MNGDLTTRRRTRKLKELPSWYTRTKHPNFERRVQKLKRPIAFLVAIGKSDRAIAKRLGITKVRRYIRHPDVQAMIAEVELAIYERKEKFNTALFWKSLDAMDHLITGKPTKKGYDRPSLRAIELLWEAPGRLPRGRGKDGGRSGGDTITNTQVNVLTREEANAAMALLAQAREREIVLDPSQVETGGGTEERS
jgi:hypothetical protein